MIDSFSQMFHNIIRVSQTSNCFIVVSISLLKIDETLLFRFTSAAARGGVSSVTEMLNADVPVDSVDPKNRWMALRWAALQNTADVTRFLLQSGTDVDNQSGYYHFTALHRVACDNQTGVIEVPLKHDASTKIKDHRGRTPIDLAREWNNKVAIHLLEHH